MYGAPTLRYPGEPGAPAARPSYAVAPPGDDAFQAPIPNAVSGGPVAPAPPPTGAARALSAVYHHAPRVVAAAPAGVGQHPPPPPHHQHHAWAGAAGMALNPYAAGHHHPHLAAYQYPHHYAGYMQANAAAYNPPPAQNPMYSVHYAAVPPPGVAPVPSSQPIPTPAPASVEESLSKEEAVLFRKFLRLTKERRSPSPPTSSASRKKSNSSLSAATSSADQKERSGAKTASSSASSPKILPGLDKPIKRERDRSVARNGTTSSAASSSRREVKRDGSPASARASASSRERRRSSSAGRKPAKDRSTDRSKVKEKEVKEKEKTAKDDGKEKQGTDASQANRQPKTEREKNKDTRERERDESRARNNAENGRSPPEKDKERKRFSERVENQDRPTERDRDREYARDRDRPAPRPSRQSPPKRVRDRVKSPSPVRRGPVVNGDYRRRSRSRSPPNRGRKRSLSPVARLQGRGASPPRKMMRPTRGPPSPIPMDEVLPGLASKPADGNAVGVNKGDVRESDNVRYHRCTPADLYYERDPRNPRVMWATPALKALCAKFERELLGIFPKPEAPAEELYSEVSEDEGCFSKSDADVAAEKEKKKKKKSKKPTRDDDDIDSGDESDASISSAKSSDLNEYFEEEERRLKAEQKADPNSLHPDLYYNEIHKRNMGPICKCSSSSRKLGIRHGVYVGEKPIAPCQKWSNNGDKLFHYKVTLAPPTNFLVKYPTTVVHDGHEFLFEGFSLLSHYELHSLPPCQLFRFYIHYTIDFDDQPVFDTLATVHELNIFRQYVFFDLLELHDLELKIGLSYEERMKQAWDPVKDDVNCDLFHFMPRFVRQLPDNGLEILSMNYVLEFLLKSWKKMLSPWDLEGKLKASTSDWADYAESMKGMVVCCPDKKPRSLRVDQLDRDDSLIYVHEWLRRKRERRRKQDYSKFGRKDDDDDPLDVDKLYPELVHFGVRPAHLTTEYHKAYREFLKARYLLVNKPRPTAQDKEKLLEMERDLRKLRTQPTMKREVTVALSTKDFFATGLYCDVVQHMLFLPILVCHLRFHKSLDSLESAMNYRFKNRYLLQLALTHPSYRENYGTNPDHSRNTQTNCGIRQAEYGDRDQYFQAIRKRGIVTLMKIMSQFGTEEEAESETMDNQRLEFFGDAVVEFLTSIHLFFMFPDQEEGSLATFRAALVQNSHLTHLARILELHKYFLYSHGPDLCLELPLRRAMANCFEALLGAIYLDGGLEAADKILAETIFKEEPDMLKVWVQLPSHPLQQQEPNGDRHLIPRISYLQKLTEFEGDTGVAFNHIRILARAFTDHSVGMTNLTLGSNQRLEFLGDTVLQLIVTEHLYLHFPSHHEGHLSLLRTTLVNNKTQAIVCDELGMSRFSLSAPHRKKVVVGESAADKPPLKMKDKADLLEAYLGALYVDKGLEICKAFCKVCFFPRLNEFIMNQDWNDPKSKLQQCCLTLRSLGESEPDIPIYEVVGCVGPTNTRIYTVAVSFRGEELARASAPSIKQAEMDAAKCALETQRDRFPHLDMLGHCDSGLRKALDRLRRQKRFDRKMNRVHNRLENGYGPGPGPGGGGNNYQHQHHHHHHRMYVGEAGPAEGKRGRANAENKENAVGQPSPTATAAADADGEGGAGAAVRKKRRYKKKKSAMLPGLGIVANSQNTTAGAANTAGTTTRVGPGGVPVTATAIRTSSTKCPSVSAPGEATAPFVLVAPALPPKIPPPPSKDQQRKNREKGANWGGSFPAPAAAALKVPDGKSKMPIQGVTKPAGIVSGGVPTANKN